MFKFEYSRRARRFVFDIVMILFPTFVADTVLDEFIISDYTFWIFQAVIFIVVLKLVAILVKRISFVVGRGTCDIENDTMIIRTEKKQMRVAVSEIKEVTYMESGWYRNFLGTDWDKLLIKTAHDKTEFLSKPNESDSLREKDLYRLFCFIVNRDEFVRDAETYGGDSSIRSYIPRKRRNIINI